MPRSREEILAELEQHRAAVVQLEAELGSDAPAASWPPAGFYLTYYVVAGATIGILASLTSFACHVIGSLATHQDPLLFLRVYGTVFLGPAALTTDDLNFFMLVAVVHFSVGATAGAVFLILVNRYIPERTALQIVFGALYGLLMWVVNFYLISRLQPLLWGQSYVLELMPAWVAAGTHLVYGLTLGLLQPLGRFVPYKPLSR
jgi:hypothetical protein